MQCTEMYFTMRSLSHYDALQKGVLVGEHTVPEADAKNHQAGDHYAGSCYLLIHNCFRHLGLNCQSFDQRLIAIRHQHVWVPF